MQLRPELPTHRVPEAAGQGPLRVEGLADQLGPVDPRALAGLPRHGLREPFTCQEGWTVPGVHWGGVRLADVLALAQPLPEARWVRVCAGDFILPLPLPLADAATTLLCDELEGRPLSVAHGAPWRLVLSGGQCFTSVKWVERLVLAAEPGPNTAENIASQRLQLAPAQGQTLQLTGQSS